MPSQSQRGLRARSARTKALAAVCELLVLTGCSSPEEHLKYDDDSPATAAREDRISYNFSASRRRSEPSACGAYLLTIQLVFEDDLHKVTAVISSQAWACELHEAASTYDITCASPSDESQAIEASLEMVLYEPPPKAQIAGEAVLTISTASGSCEHTFTVDGQLER